MKDNQRATARTSDSGFSLIEVIIAVLMLGLMAIGMLPLFVGSVQASAGNRSLVAATTLANAQLAGLRAEFGNDRTDASCSELRQTISDINAGDLDGHPHHPVAPAGSGLSAELGGPRAEGGSELSELDCTAGATGPVAVAVSVEVFPAGERDRVLASLSTEILVGAP